MSARLMPVFSSSRASRKNASLPPLAGAQRHLSIAADWRWTWTLRAFAAASSDLREDSITDLNGVASFVLDLVRHFDSEGVGTRFYER